MSPKVIKQNPEQKCNNIKNIYIQKIKSLMKISKDTIGKSQIEVINTTNRKKIKKHCSEAEKNNIRLEKNRQSAKKARQRKKIYVKLLQEQQKRLQSIWLKTLVAEEKSSEYVKHLTEKKKTLTKQGPIKQSKRKNSDADVQKFLENNQKKQGKNSLQEKINLMNSIVEELCSLSKYAYFKDDDKVQVTQQKVINESFENDPAILNIEEVLAGIQVVRMSSQVKVQANLDDLFDVQYDNEEQYEQQRCAYTIKQLIGNQYQIVSSCLNELQQITKQAKKLLQYSSMFKSSKSVVSDQFINRQLHSFLKKNTIVPQYEIKKAKPRRIDSFSSLSSANRSIIQNKKSLFSLNNFFINMREAECKILMIDRSIQQISKVLAVEGAKPNKNDISGSDIETIKQEEE